MEKKKTKRPACRDGERKVPSSPDEICWMAGVRIETVSRRTDVYMFIYTRRHGPGVLRSIDIRI